MANHTLATHCIQAGGRDEGDLVKLDASVTKEQKRDLSDFELAMIAVGFHKLLIYWGFHAQASPGSQNGPKRVSESTCSPFMTLCVYSNL